MQFLRDGYSHTAGDGRTSSQLPHDGAVAVDRQHDADHEERADLLGREHDADPAGGSHSVVLRLSPEEAAQYERFARGLGYASLGDALTAMLPKAFGQSDRDEARLRELAVVVKMVCNWQGERQRLNFQQYCKRQGIAPPKIYATYTRRKGQTRAGL